MAASGARAWLTARQVGRVLFNWNIDSIVYCRPQDFVPFADLFDTVICLNVVEHVEDDMLALRNIASALQAGGRAIVLVPQGQSIYGSMDEVLGHFRPYSEEGLREKMEAVGLHVERIVRFNRVTRPGWYINGKLLKLLRKCNLDASSCGSLTGLCGHGVLLIQSSLETCFHHCHWSEAA